MGFHLTLRFPTSNKSVTKKNYLHSFPSNPPLATSFLHNQSWLLEVVMSLTNGCSCQTSIWDHTEEHFKNPYRTINLLMVQRIVPNTSTRQIRLMILEFMSSSIVVPPTSLSTTSFLGLATTLGTFLSSRILRPIGAMKLAHCPFVMLVKVPTHSLYQGPIHNKTIFIFQEYSKLPPILHIYHF